MKSRKVRAGQIYIFEPVMIDVLHPPYNVRPGDRVKVVKLPGCPSPNVMGHCHVNLADGSFGGLVCCNSLQPVNTKQN